jgi:hypothetical protein
MAYKEEVAMDQPIRFFKKNKFFLKVKEWESEKIHNHRTPNPKKLYIYIE